MAKKTLLHTKALVSKISKKKIEAGIVEAIVGSTDVVDRLGDVIDQSGWKLSNFKKNPVILWGHNAGFGESRPPIGRAIKVWLDKGVRKSKLMFTVKFDLQDSFAAEIFRKVKDGFINTVSVGFIPLEKEENVYIKAELLELSFVPIPANPEALITLQKAGLEPVASLEKLLEDAKIRAKKVDKDMDKGAKLDLAVVEKPLPNEHACRLKSPGLFKKGSFRSMNRKHKGKGYRVIMGRLKGEDSLTDQSNRYNKKKWSASEARSHCNSKGGKFEAARKGKDIATEAKKDIKKAKDRGDKETTIKPVAVNKSKQDKVSKGKVGDKKIKKTKSGSIQYKALGVLPTSEDWDGPGEMAKTKSEDELKIICAYFKTNEKEKRVYFLPHHKTRGQKAVWRGVACSMATLLGARGGVEMADKARENVYNHLVKHYKEFDKKAPSLKAVEKQVLKNYEDEIHALVLDREEKYIIRLIKKVMKTQKKQTKKVVKTKLEDQNLLEALGILDKAVSLIIKKSTKKEV